MAEGARRLLDGERPHVRDMLLTPGNVMRVADRLSHLRGAAMKLGQMISLDSGDILPAELSEIMARLRERAHHMPPAQLQRVLEAEWGMNWRKRFARFEATPMAAASIGQVHRAVTHDGRELAVKIQYPGVRESIDADVDNVATLLRVSGFLPREIDMKPMLLEAKRQLHEETDYLREGAQMEAYRRKLSSRPEFIVPALDPEFSTSNVLAMTLVAGGPIESVANEPQEVRDTVGALFIDLVLAELFEFGVMQTDPNFANFRYQSDTQRIVLLDFGATRAISSKTAKAYRCMLVTGLSGSRDAVRDAAVEAGFIGPAAVSRHRELIDHMVDVTLAAFSRSERFDFADRSFLGVIREQAMTMAADRSTWHIPPTDTLFVQRKLSGIALLAARLGARVDVRAKVTSLLAT